MSNEEENNTKKRGRIGSEKNVDKSSEKNGKNQNILKELELEKKENELLRRELSVVMKEHARTGTSEGSREGMTGEVKLGIQEICGLIPEFKPGSVGSTDVKYWLNIVSNMMRIYNWNEHRALLYATLRLKGAAYYWYQSRQGDIKNWEQFQEELIRSFPAVNDESSVHIKIMSRKRKAAESIENYFYEIVALSKKAKLEETTIIRYIISGLGDRNLINILAASNCQNLEQLLLKIKEYEGIEEQERNRQQLHKKTNYHGQNLNDHRKRSFIQGHLDTNAKPRMIQTRVPMKNERNENRRLRLTNYRDVCFRCGREGHRKINCKTILNDRTQEKSNQGHVTYPKQVQCINTKRSEFYKTVEIEGKPVMAFVDLGSDCCTIQSTKCEQYGWEPNRKKIILKGFGGGSCRARGVINKRVKMGEVQSSTELVVVDDEAQEVPVIIGQDFLSRPGIKVIKRWKKLDILLDEEIEPNKEKRKEGQSGIKAGVKYDDINIGMVLEEPIKRKFVRLLSKYENCFALSTAQLGKTETVQMRIDIIKDEIIRYKPYRIPYHLERELEDIIKDLKENCIIENSTSEYSSPALLVKKKDNSYRMCVDYRKINKITRKEYFPSPYIEEQLNKMSKGKIFISLDFMSGYYQIAIEPRSRKYTAFVTPFGQYQFIRMPFGLCNAPAVFMRLMRIILDKIERPGVFAFMDDILIAAETTEEAMETLECLLEVLEMEHLTLNLKKCVFFTTTVTYLGHRISNGNLQPGELKLLVIKEYKEPANVKEVRQFLGLTGYFRKFISNYAHIAKPLNKLLKKDQKFEWTEDQRSAFEQLKKRLCDEPILEIYNPKLEHELHTDACARGLAGILIQVHDNGEKHVVSYFSRATTESEQKFHSYELEALAVVESLERFRYYLLGKHFKIVTDCNSLKMTQEKKDLIPRIARWWLKIQEYNFTLEYRTGSQMRHVDALSRVAIAQEKEMEEVSQKIMVTGSVEVDWVVTLQTKDRELQEIRILLEGKNKCEPEKKNKMIDYQLKGNRVYRKTTQGLRLVVPHGFRWNVVRTAHEDTGHGGIDRTVGEIQKTYWFARMRDAVKKYVSNCIDCLYNKRYKDESRYHLHAKEVKPLPFHTVHIDHLGPYTRSSKGNMHLIGLVDAFSKFVILKPVKSTCTRYVIQILEEMSQYFGLPQQVVTDRGSSFTSHSFRDFCEENSIRHIKTAVKTPRANGQVERYFRTISTAIATSTQRVDGRDWDTNISSIQWGLNSRVHRITELSPQQVILGYQPKGILGNKLTAAVYVDLLDEQDEVSLEDLRKRVAKRINENSNKVTEKYNQRKLKPQQYREGDLILIKSDPVATGQPRKHLPKYKGPYIIKRVLGSDRYVVTDPPGVQISNKPFQSIYSAERMRPWCKVEDFELAEMELIDDENSNPFDNKSIIN